MTDPTSRLPGIRPAAPDHPTTPGRATSDQPRKRARRGSRVRWTARLRARLVGLVQRSPKSPTAAQPTTPRPTERPGRKTIKPRRRPITEMPADNAHEPAAQEHSRAALIGMKLVLVAVAVLLMVEIVAPIALSSQDLIQWAAAGTGLGLHGRWPYAVFIMLDAGAAVCVLLTVYCAWRGERPGAFGVLVWVLAWASAFANFRNGSRFGAPTDAWWFFPLASLAGPLLLEVTVRRMRRWVRNRAGGGMPLMPSFGLGRWIPGVGAPVETYGAWRVARLKSMSKTDTAIAEYRRLCPRGGVRVLAAIREDDAYWAELDRLEAERPTTPTPARPTTEPTSRPTTGSDHPTRPAPTGRPTKKPTAPTLRAAGDDKVVEELRKLYAPTTDRPNEKWPAESPTLSEIQDVAGGSRDRATRFRRLLVSQESDGSEERAV